MTELEAYWAACCEAFVKKENSYDLKVESYIPLHAALSVHPSVLH